jgi:transcriptional regulator with XRE-family HTH domain
MRDTHILIAMSTKLKSERQRRQLTVAEVARAVHTDQGNLSRIENGKQVPSRDLALRLHAFYEGRVELLDILLLSHEAAA